MSHAWSRTQETPISLSFHTPATFKSRRGREQNSNSHDVSKRFVLLARSTDRALVPQTSIFFSRRGGAKSNVRASRCVPTFGRALKKHRSLSSSSNRPFTSQRGREQASITMRESTDPPFVPQTSNFQICDRLKPKLK